MASATDAGNFGSPALDKPLTMLARCEFACVQFTRPFLFISRNNLRDRRQQLQYTPAEMRHLSALLYIATAVVCDLVFAVMVGTMLVATTPMYSITGFLRTPAICIGPSLLVLAGVATLLRTNRRVALYIEASIVLLIGVASWSVPKIGWQDATWLFLYPEAASLLGAIVILLIVRKAWVGALVGAILSAPFFVYTAATLLQAHIRGTIGYTIEDVSVTVPLVLLLLSLIASLRHRSP